MIHRKGKVAVFATVQSQTKLIAVTYCFLASFCIVAADADRKPVTSQSREREIERLITQFGGTEANERVAAEKRLSALGKHALPMLRALLKHPDAEMQKRASALIDAIEKRLRRKINVSDFLFLPDGRRAVFVSTEMDVALVWVRDLKSEEDIIYLNNTPTSIGHACVSSDGKHVLLPTFRTGEDGRPAGTYHIGLWNLDTGEELRRFEGHTSCVYFALFSPDGQRVVSGSTDKTIRVWDAATGRELRQMLGHTANVMDASFSSDGKRLLTGSLDGTMRVWDFETGKELHQIKAARSAPYGPVFTPDGKRVVAGSGRHRQDQGRLIPVECTVRVWDIETGQELRRMEGHQEYVIKVAVSPDGKRILSGARDQTARLWDMETGKELACFKTAGKRVKNVGFMPKDKRAYTVCETGDLEYWQLPE